MQCFLEHRPEDALALRRAPPSHAWLAACQRCCGPEVIFVFFEELSEETEPDNAALACLLRKFQSQGSQVIARGHQSLIIVDGPMPEQLPKVCRETTTILLDRRRYPDEEVALIEPFCAQHVICEHARVFGSVLRSAPQVSLSSVWLPKATSVIGEDAFWDCSELKHVSLPVVDSIGAKAFSGCRSLKSVPLVVRDLGDAAFLYCGDLRTVSLPFARAASCELFWGCLRLTSVSMPVATEVLNCAFAICHCLTSVSLPEVRRVGECAFAGCVSLTSVSLPAARRVEERAFCGCERLETVFLPSAEIGRASWRERV